MDIERPKDFPVKSFLTQKEWRDWLAENNNAANGIWLRLFKKDSGEKTVTRKEALDEAICFGWIDGQALKYDEKSWLQKFTPRRQRSLWSKRNIEHVERLTSAGKMHARGLEEVAKAKADGRWKQAYEAPSNMTVPEDFLNELAKNKNAEAFFKTLNKTNVYSIAWRLETAKKPETRERRMQKILEMMAKGEKLY